MNKKTISLMAMIVSLAIVLCGVLVISGSMGGDTSYASGSYAYDSGYAEFGADFYTYVSNNAAEAASAARTTAANIGDIAELLKNVCGVFLMGFGMLSLCFFGMIFVGEKKVAPEAVVEELPEQACEAVEIAEEVQPVAEEAAEESEPAEAVEEIEQ